MGVIMLDLKPYASHIPSVEAHVKRGEMEPPICGEPFGMGFVLKEAEELGEPFPYDLWCPTCWERQVRAKID